MRGRKRLRKKRMSQFRKQWKPVIQALFEHYEKCGLGNSFFRGIPTIAASGITYFINEQGGA